MNTNLIKIGAYAWLGAYVYYMLRGDAEGPADGIAAPAQSLAPWLMVAGFYGVGK